MALAEKQLFQIHSTSKLPEMGKYISPPESLGLQNHELEPKDPLEYLKGDFLLPRGAKAFYKELGLLKKNAGKLIHLTPDNFMWLLGIATPRIEIQPDKPWHFNESIEVIYPGKEAKIKKQIQKMIFAQYEKDETKLAIIRVVEFDEKYREVSSGRKYKLEITSLIVAHVDQRNREIFELPLALPSGTEKEDILSVFDKSARVQIEGEDMLVVPSLEDSPQFQYGIKIYEGLLKKAEKGIVNVDIQQARGGLEIINARSEKGNIRPGETEDRIIDGHICTRDWNGQWIPKFMLFDDLEGCKKWLKFEEQVINGPDGDYEYEGGTISAATSNKDPYKKINEKIKNHFRKKGNNIIMTVHEPPNWNPINLPQVPPMKPYYPYFLPPQPRLQEPIFKNTPVYNPSEEKDNTKSQPIYPRSPRISDQSEDNDRGTNHKPENFKNPEEPKTVTPLFVFPFVGKRRDEISSVASSIHTDRVRHGNIASVAKLRQNNINGETVYKNGKIIYMDFPGEKVLEFEAIQHQDRIPTDRKISYPGLPKPDKPSGGGETIIFAVKDEQIGTQETVQNLKSINQKQDTDSIFSVTTREGLRETNGVREHSEGKVNTNTEIEHQETELISISTNLNYSEITLASLNADSKLSSGQELKVTQAQREDIGYTNYESRKAQNTIETPKESPESIYKQERRTTEQEIGNYKLKDKQTQPSQNPKSDVIKVPDFIIIPPEFYQIADPAFGEIINLQRYLMGIAPPDLTMYWQQAEHEGKLKEVYQQAMQIAGNYQQAVYTVGLIFVILLNLLSGGIVIA